VLRRVTELAEEVIGLGQVEIGHPVAGKVAEQIRQPVKKREGALGKTARGSACGEKNPS
jgi:hypothetical protein